VGRTGGGAIRRGVTAHLHLFRRPEGDLVLPALPGPRVVAARMLASGETVAFRQKGETLRLTIPESGEVQGSLVVALMMDAPLDGLPAR